MGRVIAAGLFAATALTGQHAAAACANDPAPCQVALGEYHIRLPDGPPKGAMLYIHGFGGNGSGAIRPKEWVNTALSRGYAVIAPDGLPFAEGRPSGWSFFPGRAKNRDELAFLTSVRDDAAARFDLDADAMILTGFSIGGSMTSYVACEEPNSFSVFAPVAGGFWRPHPDGCAGPVRLFHTHGWTDTTVPLEGRVIRGEDANDPAALVQGDIFYTMRMWREANDCTQLRADRFVTTGPFLRRSWDRCADGSALEFAVFPGGHVVPEGWADMMLDWAEGLSGE